MSEFNLIQYRHSWETFTVIDNDKTEMLSKWKYLSPDNVIGDEEHTWNGGLGCGVV